MVRRQVESRAPIREGGHPVPDVRDGLAVLSLINGPATAVATRCRVLAPDRG